MQSLYEKLLADVPGVHVHCQPADGRFDSNYWLCTITIDENVHVKGQENVYKEDDFICLTDIVRLKGDESRAADIIKNWLRNRSTIEFLGTWECLYNPDFKVVEFDHFRKEAGLPTFTMSVINWIDNTNAIGIVAKASRYGGTYAHRDIAFEFCSAAATSCA